MLNTFILKNGLQVATYSIPEMRSVYLSLSVKGGSIFDNKKTSGTAHFMEHILFEGSPSFPDTESLHDFIESIAGSFNAVTQVQAIKFYISAPATHLEDLIKIGSEVFFEPFFHKNAIERERNAILEEIRGRQDNLWYETSKFYSGIRYKPGHPFLLDGGGTEEAVKKLQRKDLVEYWEKFFLPKNTYLVIVGNFNNVEAQKSVQKYFDKYNSKKSFPGFPDFTNKDLSDRQVAIRYDKKLNTCYLNLSFPSMDASFPLKDLIAQGIARNILGVLRSSRLFRLLRHQKGLVYDTGVSTYVYQKFGLVDFYSQVSAENLLEVIELVAKEIKLFIENGPTDEEVAFAKNYSMNQTLMEFDNPGSIAEWIDADLLWEDKIYTPEENVEIIRGVTRERINALIKEHWDFSKLNLVVQGPFKNSQAHRQIITDLISALK